MLEVDILTGGLRAPVHIRIQHPTTSTTRLAYASSLVFCYIPFWKTFLPIYANLSKTRTANNYVYNTITSAASIDYFFFEFFKNYTTPRYILQTTWTHLRSSNVKKILDFEDQK